MNSALLINASEGDDPLVYPIGLDYLASSLSRAGIEIRCLDLALCKPSSRENLLRKTLSGRGWDIVAFNLRNVCDQTSKEIRYIPALKKLAGIARTALEDTIIAVGGSGASLAPDIIMKETGADVVIAGDGEAGFGEILNGMEDGTVKGKIIRARADIGSISYRRGSWGSVKEYARLGADGNLQTRRGCGKRCAYCAYPVIEGHSVRLRDPEIAAGEFLQLERLGFKKIFIVDAVFNDPLSHAKQVLRELRAAGTRAEWTGFFSPRHIDRELLDLVRVTGGGRPLKLTIESGSDAILKALGKDFRRDHIASAAGLCRKAGVPFSFTVLFGGPGENRGTIAETCDLIMKLEPSYVSASIGVYVYPQTEMANRTKGSLWRREEELLGDTVLPVNRTAVKKQVESLLAGSPFPVYVH